MVVGFEPISEKVYDGFDDAFAQLDISEVKRKVEPFVTVNAPLEALIAVTALPEPEVVAVVTVSVNLALDGTLALTV